jgi:predicted RNase H-like HicB family nuclease
MLVERARRVPVMRAAHVTRIGVGRTPGGASILLYTESYPGDGATMRQVKVVIEKLYVAYPLDLIRVVVGQGDTHAKALANVTSAIRFHAETLSPRALVEDTP